jgi:hypothetical protein
MKRHINKILKKAKTTGGKFQAWGKAINATAINNANKCT